MENNYNINTDVSGTETARKISTLRNVNSTITIGEDNFNAKIKTQD